MTKLASNLPKGDSNGLDSLARRFMDNPREVHVVIGLVDCRRLVTDTDTDTVEPTLRIRRIEVITDADKEQARQMLRRSLEKRTGQTVLPLDLEDDIAAAFKDIDFTTGEVLDPEPREVDTGDADPEDDDA